MKRLLLGILCLAALGWAQDISSNQELYLGMSTQLTDYLHSGNPASLTEDMVPYKVSYEYDYSMTGGSFRSAYMPDSTSYSHAGVSAFKKMENNAIFAGSFSYRDENTKNKLWLHAAENDMLTPFYFADSTIGNYHLNGIDWQIVYASSLGKHGRYGIDIFYNVDEQFKSVFPKPNIKRNNIRVTPGYVWLSNKLELGISASLFNYKENIYTKKYSLEQGKTPTFITIRGLDNPIMSYAETSHERLQTITGLSAGAHIYLNQSLFAEAAYESAQGEITDGGAYAVAQGVFNQERMTGSVRKILFPNSFIRFIPYFQADIQSADATHPTLLTQIYEAERRSFNGGLQIPISMGERAFALAGWYEFRDIYEADLFTGCSYYVPADVYGGSCTVDHKEDDYSIRLILDASSYTPRNSTVFSENTGWYFNSVTQKTIDYLTQSWIKSGLTVSAFIPVNSQIIKLSLAYHMLNSRSSSQTRNDFQTTIDYIF